MNDLVPASKFTAVTRADWWEAALANAATCYATATTDAAIRAYKNTFIEYVRLMKREISRGECVEKRMSTDSFPAHFEELAEAAGWPAYLVSREPA
jgi:hypothetical protein